MHRNDFVRQLNSPGGDRRPSRVMHIDIPLLLILIALCSIGLAVLYSASAESIFYVKRQATFMVIGLFSMIVIAQFKPRLWERWSIFIYLCGLLSLVAVLFFGVGAKGAQRWLDLGVTRFQPSELMKIAVPMTLASYLSKRHIPPRFKHVSLAVIATTIPVLLVARQPDLGTSLIIFSSGFFALFLAGLGKRYLLSTALLAMAAVPTLWFYVMLDYQKQRVLTLLSPEQDKLGAGWNIMQSTTAIGSGGWSGKGWTQGTQSQLNFLPESHTDFIIAVLAEEFGLIGVLGMLVLYLLLIGRCMIISLNAQSMFGRIMAGTISLTFFVYIFVNMGMVSGILPVVGAPLPFISYGGTAIVTLFLGFGILMAISTEPKRI
jgi:rod shape determining protein RodA